MKAVSIESEVFSELSALCQSPGYIHALSFICLRDNFTSYESEVTGDDILHTYKDSRLLRSEISTLAGLMVKAPLDLSMPDPDLLEEYVTKSDATLHELHEAILAQIPVEETGGVERVKWDGRRLREAILYSGESAYSFQYRDLSIQKYRRDEQWLLEHKGFLIQDAIDVHNAIGRVQESKVDILLERIDDFVAGKLSALQALSFTVADVLAVSSLSAATTQAVLDAFSFPDEERNERFDSVQQFNAVNAFPLIKIADESFALFHVQSMAEALYESPFYWFSQDDAYRTAAMKNRGKFTEEYCHQRLVAVFGDSNVYPNVSLYRGKVKVAEIDVLVVFGNRRIVLEAKSKRLTIQARQGDDSSLEEDFTKSIQGSYDQALKSARLLLETNCTVLQSDGTPLRCGHDVAEVYLLTVVSDHYPSLNYQVHQSLTFTADDTILPPFVIDLFTLDILAEFLDSPLRFLSYIKQRVGYSTRLFASHESTVLAYHLVKNLWMADDQDFMLLHDSVSIDLDVAMLVRREQLPGNRTPDGILTRFTSTPVGHLLRQIEHSPEPALLELGYLLLTLDEDTNLVIAEQMMVLAELFQKDGRSHDFTLPMGNSGLTLHCNREDIVESRTTLMQHCENRKYFHKADSWYGLCVDPGTFDIRFAGVNQEKWIQDNAMDEYIRYLKMGAPKPMRPKRYENVKRNDPCPCGSKVKFKNCHGRV